MKRYKRVVAFSLLIFLLACVDQPFYDVYNSIGDRNWYRHQHQVFRVHITDKQRPYDVLLYVRHTGEYNFDNLFFSSHESGPGIKKLSVRHELKLAAPDGRWIGNSAGNRYENKYLLKENYMFPDTGTFVFEIAQNMRENPLENITDIGLKIVAK